GRWNLVPIWNEVGTLTLPSDFACFLRRIPLGGDADFRARLDQKRIALQLPRLGDELLGSAKPRTVRRRSLGLVIGSGGKQARRDHVAIVQKRTRPLDDSDD